ncbi:MAG TPA: GNAT family N-acetyltransferase [Acidimicrobiales bacterium]|nr:GNAT family N-acetyltransferase [Acidimicrobiales bacterium]
MRGGEGGPVAGGRGGTFASVRVGGPADAGRAASLHGQLISEGFLASLGAQFLRRLYGRIARSDDSFLLVAEAEGTVVGFIAGSVALGRLYRSFLLRDSVVAALSAPVGLVTALPRVFETLRHGLGHGLGGADTHAGELLAVAVDPRFRGRRVGLGLVEGFLGELERRGAGAASVVVGADNASAIAMYERAGFTVARSFEMHRGTRSVVMETAVPSRAVPYAEPGS